MITWALIYGMKHKMLSPNEAAWWVCVLCDMIIIWMVFK